MGDDPAKNWINIRKFMQPLNQKLFDSLGDRVRSGPFQGMRIGMDVKWDDGNVGTKLLGSYEFELHGVIEKAIRRNPDTVINVGCAEGYYAVGFSKLLPFAHVCAVDCDGDSLNLCLENAHHNNVSRDQLTAVFGRPSPYGLQELGKGRNLIFVDIEGEEEFLLDKAQCSILPHSDIIVECHDFIFPEIENPISAKLRDRFADSHEIEWIPQGIPYPGDYPWLSKMPIGTALMCLTEKRPIPTVWLACWAHI